MGASSGTPVGVKPWYLRRWSWVLVVLLLIGFVRSLSDPDTKDPAQTASSTSASPLPGSSSPTTSLSAPGAPAQVTDEASAAEAAAVLAMLPVKGRAPKTGYDRALFGDAWTDDVTTDGGHNGCDTRNDVLRRDLVDVVLKPGPNGCAVQSGTLHDPYTATVIAFVRGQDTSAAVQIDHVVALADAWQKGAQQLTAEARIDFANDPLNLQATDGPTNQAKGAGDAATWLPPNKSYRCTYVTRQVEVKVKYGLWVTAAERDVIVAVLSSCGAAPATPTTAQTTPPPPATTQAPAPVPAVPHSTTAAPAPVPPAQVYYQNCSVAKAAGAAPLYAGQPGYRPQLDGDNDGVACEP